MPGWDSWVSPDNIKAKQSAFAGRSKRGHSIVGVSCTDYAMQNVALQLGLELLSLDGLRVATVRQFVQRCDACGLVVRDAEAKFCSACGNGPLRKASVEATAAGDRIHQAPPRLRGTQFPLPLPKGGRTPDIVLAPDQYELMKRKHRDVQVGFGNKNPNVSRRRVGKKNKTKMSV